MKNGEKIEWFETYLSNATKISDALVRGKYLHMYLEKMNEMLTVHCFCAPGGRPCYS